MVFSPCAVLRPSCNFFGHLLTEAMNPAAIIQVGENMIRAEHPHIMKRAEHPSNMTWHNNSPINATDTNSVRRLIRRRTLTAVSSPPIEPSSIQVHESDAVPPTVHFEPVHRSHLIGLVVTGALLVFFLSLVAMTPNGGLDAPE